MEIYLAKTQGFCAGVSFAIDIVEKALKKYGMPIYVFHDIVHNTHVVNDFRSRGVVFVEDLGAVPEGDRVIFSAHGVPPEIVEEAKKRNLKIIDATCPLVAKVHKEAIQYSQAGIPVVLIGHKNHQEIIGTSGYVNPKLLHIIQDAKDVESLQLGPAPSKIGVITQTTLSVDETRQIMDSLKKKFPDSQLLLKADLCYATQNRQDAVKELAQICDLIIVCGSRNSSNSNRLRETGSSSGVETVIIDSVNELDMEILENKNKIGITSGASVPRFIVEDVVETIRNVFTDVKIHSFENPEKDIIFKLPEI
ncbi:MAG: 4-hydroxy-3-methylbut-2-enyl diphosphate reductase [Candidatus Omnitrophica bacterium]|nr:4-hydroxy-3-methylbut-2-enyl diphosphate reductase [Candidatus Omnitrophota bacterium]